MCITCSLPVETAPETIKYHCFVTRQPETPEEIDRMMLCSDPEINDVVWASPDELTEPHQTNALDGGIPSGLNTLRQRRGGVPFVRPQMRNIAFLVVIAVFSCGCAGPLYSPLPGENPTASTEVGLSVMTAEAPNREIEYRTYRDFLLYVNGPDVQEALAIVD